MPGKKAHKPRETGNAAKFPVPKGGGRKSAAQTPGQYVQDPKRRLGQYSGAGEPPLMKK